MFIDSLQLKRVTVSPLLFLKLFDLVLCGPILTAAFLQRFALSAKARKLVRLPLSAIVTTGKGFVLFWYSGFFSGYALTAIITEKIRFRFTAR
ncbi:hypothetical protein DRT62_16810 [Salmonella enterica subsp. enterica serovar Saintpaul]|uniref:Uncharacterized protein n=1 Tax=Salmonella enterica subsp. enterica serovar Saintpaul TaxID=90105 RepID=A0A5U9I445_SALET|nr:hypothetical protein [Salmonella enterica]EBS2301369.1 hypothetical protein [Salmonella enterica subsp. enterica serovar Saintpaul]ECA8470432.1 hypothetical protein [Salmonella enterica subsp. enterica serovar Saintpaul]MEN58529.1 hypothetical protein [Salmonella enterica]